MCVRNLVEGSDEGMMMNRRRMEQRKSKILMKRRRARFVEGCRSRSRRRGMGMRTRVRTLKRLIPNTQSMNLDGLFRETAQYILALQTRVRVMQIMLHVFTPSNSHHQ